MNISEIAATGKRFGYRIALIEVIHRIANKFVMLIIIRPMVLELKHANPEFSQIDERFKFVQATPDQIFAFDEDPDIHLPRFYVERSIAKGDFCYAILDGKTLVNYCWYSTKPTTLVEKFEVQFGSEWLYAYANFTSPKYRGRAMFARGAYAACKTLANIGKKGLIIVVDYENFHSLFAARKVDYRIIGWVFVLKLFGRYIIIHSRRCRDYGFSIRPLDRRSAK